MENLQKATKPVWVLNTILPVLFLFNIDYIYYGTFGKNSRNGFGIMKKSTKEIYLGEWVNNKRQGWGKVFNYNGEMIFDGDFEEGRFT